MNRFVRGLAALILLGGIGCASRVLEYAKSDEKLKTEEYDSKLQVKAANEAPPPVLEVTPADQPGKKKKKVKKETKKEATAKPPGPHLPDIEDGEGFIGRRPINDPF